MKRPAFPSSADDRHVNGWPAIRRYLTLRHRTQSALASALGISPSAVTQIKQGAFLLNSEHLDRIADFLQMDREGVTAFYAQVFRARLLTPDPEAERGFVLHYAPAAAEPPECPVPWLEAYEPATESLTGYLARRGCSGDRVRVLDPRAGVRAVLHLTEDPRPGDTVWLKVRGVPGRIVQLIAWTPAGGQFRDGEEEFAFPFSRIAWLRPAEISR